MILQHCGVPVFLLLTAACAVYERACRIAHELEGPEALYQQSRQLSVAATNLSNAAEKDQWVLVYQGSGRGRGSSKHPHFVKDLKELRKEGCVARNLMRVKDRQTIKLTPVTGVCVCMCVCVCVCVCVCLYVFVHASMCTHTCICLSVCV